MHVRYLLDASPLRVDREPTVFALSEFDGVHAGHLRLVRGTIEGVAKAARRVVAVILWPGPESADPVLTTLDERIELLCDVPGLDEIVVLPMSDGEKSDIGTLCELLSRWYYVQAVTMLDGPRAQRLLRAAIEGDAAAWPFEIVPAADVPSLERIAERIAAGEVAEAARLLGHPYAVRGHVVLGDQRGRLLGFPTANLRPDPRKVLPANGIYAVRVRLPGEVAAIHPAVANIGVRPTFGEGNATLIEAHLLEGALDLYGLPITVELVEWLRAELRFPNVEALKAQMASDVRYARDLLAASAVETARQPDEPR